jgi:hypothetical protein
LSIFTATSLLQENSSSRMIIAINLSMISKGTNS